MKGVAEMLNQIKNAQGVARETVSVPFSNFKYQIAQILEAQGFVEKTEKKSRNTPSQKTIEIKLKYVDKKPVLTDWRLISRSSQSVYCPWEKMKSSSFFRGMVVVSTSQGLMTSRQARKKKLGGELICEVW